MKTIHILLIAIIANLSTANAQFIREYFKAPSNPASFQAVVPADSTPTSNLYVAGMYGNQMMIAEVKQSGSLEWSRKIMVNDVDYRINSMIVDSDGNIVFTGGKSIGVDDDAYGFIAKFNPIAKSLVWFKSLETTVWFFDITEGVAGGSYFVSGQEEDLGNGNQSDLVVYSVDRATGSMTTIANLNKNVNETGECVIFEPTSSSLYVGGRCEIVFGLSKYRICLTKMDTLGNIAFSNYYVKSTASSARMYGRDMILDDTTIVLVGFGDDGGTSTFKNLYFLRFGLDGTLLSTKEYDITTNSSDGVLASVKVYDEGYMIYGHGYTVADEDIFLMNVDKLGNINWMNTYPYQRSANPSGWHFVSSLAVVGEYAFHVGKRIITDGTQVAILMRVPIETGDAGSCEFPLTTTTTDLTTFQSASGLIDCSFDADILSPGVSVKKLSLSTLITCVNDRHDSEFSENLNDNVLNSELVIIPNPANEHVTFKVNPDYDILAVMVVNLSGQVVYNNQHFDSAEMIDCSEWAVGLYSVVVTLQNGEVETSNVAIVRR